MDQATLTSDISFGVSNEIMAEAARISFTKGKLLVLETRD